MPATNPRLTITMQPSLAAVLRRLSEVTGNSQSAIIADLLGETLPVLERMAHVLEAAAKLKADADSVPKSIVAGLERAQGRMETQLGLALDDLEAGYRPILEHAEKVQRRSKRSPASARTAPRSTPVSNRGVTPHPTGTKTVRKKGGSRGSI